MNKHQGQYVEVKARKSIGIRLAEKIVDKKTISVVLTTGRIWGPARDLFDLHGITWADNLPANEILNYNNTEK